MTGQVAATPAAVEANNAPGDTGSGFLVGVTPAQPQQQVDWTGASAPTGSPEAQVQIVAQAPQGVRYFTEEDINRARSEEKEKLYPRLTEMQEQLRTLTKEREEREAAEAAAREAAETEARTKAEEAMSAKQLVEQVRRETDERLARVEQERAAEQALFAKEREFAQLQEYKRDTVEQYSEHIMPELRDFITGNTVEEIDASIQTAMNKTAEILGHVQQTAVQTRQDMVGISPTAPPVGPMETATTHQTISPADIAGMSMAEYAKNRPALLNASRQAYQSGL